MLCEISVYLRFNEKMGRETGGISILPRSIFTDLWRRTIQGPVSDFVVVELQGDPVFGLAFSLREVEVGWG